MAQEYVKGDSWGEGSRQKTGSQLKRMLSLTQMHHFNEKKKKKKVYLTILGFSKYSEEN